MKKIISILSAGLCCCALTACVTTSTVTPPTATTPAITNTVTTLDPATLTEIDAAIADITSNAPAAIADAQAISALVHGTNK